MDAIIFSYTFQEENGGEWDLETVRTFIISKQGYDKIVELHGAYDEFSGTVLMQATEEIESEFGLHDWGTGSEPDSRIEKIGFGGNEVELGRRDEMMDRWRKVFIDIVGEEAVSSWVEIHTNVKSATDIASMSTDDESYRETVRKLAGMGISL